MEKLPSRPSLEHLKAQAKDLLEEARSGDTSALSLLVDSPELNLATAQLAVARRYGFDSWPKLKAHVEAARAEADEAATAFVEAALDNDLARAEAMLHKYPDLPDIDHWVRLAYGGDSLPVGLEVNSKGGPLNLEPLMATCFSGYLRGHERSGLVRRLAIELLDRGADPNVYRQLDDQWKTQETPLYGAVGPANDPELAAALIARGARPDDNESLYHSSEHGSDNRCLKLVLEAGPSPEMVSFCVKRKLDFEDPEGVQMYLDHGIDLNNQSDPALHHALMRNRSVQILAMLLDAGADPDKTDSHGFTAYQTAYRAGMTDAADLIASRGGNRSLTRMDRFVGKVMRDEDLQPDDLMGIRPTEEDQESVTEAADRGNARALIAMMAAGFDANKSIRHGASPAHWAALNGHADAVKVLAEAGAILDMQDNVYGSYPIGFACWGSLHTNCPSGDYPETVRVLLSHGSPKPKTDFGSEEVLAVLRGAP